MTEPSTGRIHLKLPKSAEILLREGAYKKFGMRKGSLQRFVVYCVLMACRLESILDGNLGMKKQVQPVIMHDLNRHFSSTQGLVSEHPRDGCFVTNE